MAAGKPFIRGGIVFPSQYAYRQALAQRAGFETPYQRRQAIEKIKENEKFQLAAQPLSKEERGVLAGLLADNQGRGGTFVEGLPAGRRGADRLPPELVALLRRLEGRQYPLWRQYIYGS